VRFVVICILVMFPLDGICWALLDRLAHGTGWRKVIALFMSLQLVGLACLAFNRWSHGAVDRWLPKFAVASVLIWHCLAVLLISLAAVPILLFKAIVALMARRLPSESVRSDRQPEWTRRQFLGFAAAAAPPLFTLSLATIAMQQLNHFRVRRFVLPIRHLPSDLHGLTIAQVSDIHVGRFTSEPLLGEMIKVVNRFRADLVLLTGDLINDTLADLDYGLELARAMIGRVYLIEGNHDLLEDPEMFERRVKASGIPFLLDESAILSVRGTPIQLLGLSWTRARENWDEAIASSVRQLLHQRQPDAFPILLAHHPHAFDAAAEASMPLTLSGHTHGGQLMLNERCGCGPALFRYWSGLYTRGESKLIVSNGVGNWFPLRVRAPAEIVHLTLVRL